MQGILEINRGAKTTIGQSGVGFIVIPDDNNREGYINDCYRTMSVTMNGGYGYGYISNVKILGDVLQQIKFPLKSTDRGTPVFWIRENFSNRPIIIGVIPEGNYTNLLTEGQGRYVQQVGERVVEIFEDATNGVLNISVVSDAEHPANVRIKASSGTPESVLTVESDGMVRVSGNRVESSAREDFKVVLKNSVDDEVINIEGNKEGINVTAQDLTVNVDCGEINLKTSNKLNLDSGKEPMVLGETLKGILEDILKAIQAMTFTTAVGPSSIPVNVADFASIQAKLKNILSQKSNLE